YGTLAANWVGLLIALLALRRFGRGRRLWCGMAALFKGGELRKFFGVNSDLFFRSACIMTVSMAVTAYGARLGDLTLAVNAVMMQFFILFSYFMDGLAFSGEALCGRSAGAADRDALRSAVRAITAWGAGVAAVFALIYLFLLPEATGLLTDVAAVRDGVAAMHLYVVAIPVVSTAAFLYDGFFIGLTATRRMLVTTFLAASVFFMAVWFGPKENPTLWAGFLGYLLVRGVGLALQLPAIVRKRFGKV
ncbi:MAG: MATE family efflux transporter, partial [Duncaniella sp.]|nr:MATE family efflux transporter [Duncaniella sp.]